MCLRHCIRKNMHFLSNANNHVINMTIYNSYAGTKSENCLREKKGHSLVLYLNICKVY